MRKRAVPSSSPDDREHEKANREGRKAAHGVGEVAEILRHIERDDEQSERKSEHGVAESFQSGYFAAAQTKAVDRFGLVLESGGAPHEGLICERRARDKHVRHQGVVRQEIRPGPVRVSEPTCSGTQTTQRSSLHYSFDFARNQAAPTARASASSPPQRRLRFILAHNSGAESVARSSKEPCAP